MIRQLTAALRTTAVATALVAAVIAIFVIAMSGVAHAASDTSTGAAVAAASAVDVAAGVNSDPVPVNPAPATAAEMARIRSLITAELRNTAPITESMWNREVTQWNPSWISYDSYFRPVLLNPYCHPLQLVYSYADGPRIVTVAPLQRVVLTVPDPGVYSFTTLVCSASGTVESVSVGSFTGGGYVPPVNKPRPTPPATPPTVVDALVRIRYAWGASEPFRVQQLSDLGVDTITNSHRVLINDAVPAWGTWTCGADGDGEFDISMTMLLPGLTAPAQDPVPGYQAVALVSSQTVSPHQPSPDRTR